MIAEEEGRHGANLAAVALVVWVLRETEHPGRRLCSIAGTLCTSHHANPSHSQQIVLSCIASCLAFLNRGETNRHSLEISCLPSSSDRAPLITANERRHVSRS